MSASETERLRDIWGAVDSLIDRAPSLEDLREHRLHLLAERRWCETGKTIPAALTAEKTLAVALFLPVSGLLARIGTVWTGPIIILKGPELASRYPEGFRRTAGDIDLLVDDADAAHAALRAAGFVPTGDPRRYVDIHHLQPLVWPGLPVRIEVHHSLKWIEGLEPPSTAELFALAAPSRVDVDGFQTLTPAAHAVVVAIHAWSHGPLRSLRDLIDVAVLKAEADSVEIESLVAHWGVSDVWRTTDGVVNALFASGRRPLALRLWARHLESARSPTVAEAHLEWWLSSFWALPARCALQRAVRRLADDLQPAPGERWRTKLSRARLALRNAGVRRSSHQRLLEETRLATPPELFRDRVARRRGDIRDIGARPRPSRKESR
jgi:hypothetical protein